jgi:hypothetical protein
VTSACAVVRREPTRFTRLQAKSPIQNGELVVALADTTIETAKGAVRVTLLPNLARLSTLPVVESAVALQETSATDLDLTLDRGRIEVTNQQSNKSPAQVRLRFRKETWDLTLASPGTQVAMMLYGRWPRGVPFTKDAKAEEEPTADLVLYVLKGDVQLKTRTDQHALHGPRGPASFHWNSVVGADSGPTRQEEPPAWIRAEHPAPANTREPKTAVEQVCERLANKPVEEALFETLGSADAEERQIAVNALGALDDLTHLVAALADAKHEDTRNAAIVALRHWIGRGPQQDLRLYRFLMQSKAYSANQAEIVLELLHSFGETDLARPAAYETLIDYLTHDKLAIRQLAKWHLDRLVPAGRDIAFNPAGSREERQRAYEQWKKLIPNGKLPPPSKSK